MKTMSVSQLEFEDVATGSAPRSAETNSASIENVPPAVGPSRIGTKERASVVAAGIERRTLEALLTFAEAARVLGISLRQFRRLVDGGKVAFVKVSERSPAAAFSRFPGREYPTTPLSACLPAPRRSGH